MRKSFIRWIIAILVMVTLGACQPISGARGTATPTPVPLTGRVTFAGSTTVQPLAAELGQAFNSINPDVVLEIAAGGSSVGIQAIHDGTVDIGMVSRSLKPEEEMGIAVYQVAVDVIAVVVNNANTVSNLTMGQLRDIYMGEITNWADVGGPDADITVVVRETTSGTRKAFDELVLDDQKPLAPIMEPVMTAGDVAAFVSNNANAIGYVGFGNFEEALRPISIDGTAPTEENALSGEYPLMRPLLLLTGPLSHPLAMAYINFALSEEGQAVVAESGWIPAK